MVWEFSNIRGVDDPRIGFVYMCTVTEKYMTYDAYLTVEAYKILIKSIRETTPVDKLLHRIHLVQNGDLTAILCAHGEYPEIKKQIENTYINVMQIRKED